MIIYFSTEKLCKLRQEHRDIKALSRRSCDMYRNLETAHKLRDIEEQILAEVLK